ncbi:MAG: choice-of-anchor T family protein [Candidatus Thermoplasmatota archaeon]|nr:choice-of-anchor T family protein [Candidatus Thermoplasmatota archaeon]
MQRKTLFLYLSMIILIGSVILFVPDKIEAAPPDVTLSLDESEVEVDVGPGATCQVHIFGSVKCRDHVQIIQVNLQAETGYGYTAIIPNMITLDPGENEERFEISINVPKFSSVATYTITAGGSYQTIPGGIQYELEPAKCILKIKPFMIIRVTTTDNKVTAKAGGQVDISLTINNDGNYDEQFHVSLSDKSESNVKDWQISFVPDATFKTQERQNHNLTLRINIPDDIPDRKYLLIISITAGDGSEGNAAEYSLSVNVQSDSLLTTEMWPWLVSTIIVALLIFMVIWKRKFIFSKFRRNHRK